MPRMIQCAKLGVKAEAMERQPFPGVKGKKLYETISKQAWKEWLAVQTILINEHRLESFDSKSRQFIEQERDKFLFGGGTKIPEVRPPES